MTVRYKQQEFPDEFLRPYNATKRAVNNYYADECEGATVSGMPEGIGKSGY